MRCLTCDYDLSKLTARRCPECGRAFDPDDARTFRFSSFWRCRLLLWSVALSCYPVISIGLYYLTWLVAWIDIGHRPRPWLDDPNYCGPTVQVFSWISAVLLLGVPFALITALVLGAFAVRSERSRLKTDIVHYVVTFLLPLTLFLACSILFVTDPFAVMDWISD